MAARGTSGGLPDREGDTVASATRALVDATGALSRLLGKQVSVAGEEVSEAIATGLREASRGLADASASVDKARGSHSPRGAQRRRERVDRTRGDLLDAAGRVFAAQGFEGASVGDVAAAAGYTKGAVYAHFGSKSELFLTLARERVLDACEQPEQPEAPADLATEISRQLAASVDDPSMLLVLEVLAYAVRHPDARPELAGLLAGSIDVLARQVRDDRVTRESSAAAPPADDAAAPASAAAQASAAESPSADDYDSAIGVLAVANIAALLAAVSVAPRLSVDAGARVVTRLLRGETDR